ncbi:MAG: putative spermidine synthase with an N-terminal rane domain [Bacteroidetes bacterium]|nr:putative spermidine synthase with an N-terminal rane domain [Bacteroidota bacterium]
MSLIKKKKNQLLLLVSVFVIATCGLIYELIAGTLASYLLGDSVTQFSTIIGIYLFSMGIGSYLSKFIKVNLLSWFIQIEILVGVVGGVSSTILFIAFEHASGFHVILYSLIILTGTLVGLEIPLLMRILKDEFDFSELVSKVFTFDYIGALFASILFPLFMVPYMGLLKTSYFFGLLNIVVAIVLCFTFESAIKYLRFLRIQAFIATLLLLIGFVFAEQIQTYTESMSFNENIIFSKSSPYQRIILTSDKGVTKLYLNNNLQFSSADEYRYHEALVHPGLSRISNPKNILILGGGDGLAVREVLKYPTVDSITLVDLDSSVTALFKHSELLQALNNHSLTNPKLHVINTDAFSWLKQNHRIFDFIIIDFPDPSNFSVGKLYTTSFYKEIKKALSPTGAFVVQSTSPFVARKSFWCVNNTMQSVGFKTLAYHLYVPSFGEWGYVMGFYNLSPTPYFLPDKLKYYDESRYAEMTSFPKDMACVPTEINKLNNQILIHYFEDEWGKVQ